MHPVLSKSLGFIATGALVTTAVFAVPVPPAPRATIRSMYGLKPPPKFSPDHTALLLVDFQEEFFGGRLPLPDGARAVDSAVTLLAWARRSGIHVVHVRNEVTKPGSPIFATGSPTTRFVAALTPRASDLVITKHLAGAFSRTTLEDELTMRGIDTVIVAGLMTHLAVLSTVSDATVLGYRTILASDATATRPLPDASGSGTVDAATVQRVALAIIGDRVADVLSNAALLAVPVDPR